MPLQSRVDPWGRLNAVASKASTIMGNRGILHDGDNRIIRQWERKAWVSCLPSFKGIKRPSPFSPGNYSELFFLDEATAFAAGHRPCAYCQRKRHQDFKAAWLHANATEESRSSTNMPSIDKALHDERAIRGGGKRTFAAKLADLPPGAIFEHDEQAFLITNRGYLPWSFDEYGAPDNIDDTTIVTVLTPASIVRAFANGFAPEAHLAANA